MADSKATPNEEQGSTHALKVHHLRPAPGAKTAVSYTHLTLPTKSDECRSRWSPYH